MSSIVNSPLRYPGGKSLFTDYFRSYLNCNNISTPIYAEPYCGGAGAAINLLKEHVVDKIYLNDADISIYSFWYSLKHFGSEFIKRIEETNVDLSEWNKQKEIFIKGKNGQISDLLQIGFSTFFLNRCNRSGILNAGPIGGKSIDSQNRASYKIDARFNKAKLIEKISNLILLSSNIEVFNLDALSFLSEIISSQNRKDQRNTFVYLDPPYYSQGSNLYLNYYQKSDHEQLRNYLISDKINFKWLLSYDNVKAIRELYKDFEMYTFYINYTAQQSKLGSELLINCKNSILPESKIIRSLKNNRKIELASIT